MNTQEQHITDHVNKLEKQGLVVLKVYVKPAPVARNIKNLPVIPDARYSGGQYALKYRSQMKITDLDLEERINVTEKDEAGYLIYYVEGDAS